MRAPLAELRDKVAAFRAAAATALAALCAGLDHRAAASAGRACVPRSPNSGSRSPPFAPQRPPRSPNSGRRSPPSAPQRLPRSLPSTPGSTIALPRPLGASSSSCCSTPRTSSPKYDLALLLNL
ncbi:hypothetical protein ACQ4PT_018106 [Festuca glaucescens]